MATTEEKDDGFCSAINPFALAEAVSGKKINWNKEKDPDKKLAEILGIKNPKAIFDEDSPFLFPRKLKYDAETEKVTVVSAAKDVERLKSFYKKNAVVAQKTVKSKNVKQAEALQPDVILSKVGSVLFPNLDTSKTKSSSIPTKWMVKGDFIVDSMIGQEVQQGTLGDCYFLAALASVQWSRPEMLNCIKLNNGSYKFRFWNKSLRAEWVTVTQSVEVRKSDGAWLYGRSNTYNETWPALWEKAFAKWMSGTSSDHPDMQYIAGGKGDVALRRLTGYRFDDYYCSSSNSNNIWRMLELRTDSSGKTIYPVAVNTSGRNRRDTIGTIPHHVYSVLGIETYKGTKYIIVRNPWASDPVKKYCRSGSWNGLKLNDNGIFSMKFDKFLEYFLYIYFV